MATAINLPAIYRSPTSRQGTLAGAMLAFLVFYTIAFPKGGIKAAGVPLTIGYVVTLFLLMAAILRAKRLSLPLDRMLAFLPCLLLGIWSALVVGVNGTDELGYTISYFVSLLYLPVFGLTVFSGLVLDQHHQLVERALLWSVRFIVVYGIFLFFYRQFTGHWIEIPYLTVNVADVGQLDDKFINRGGIFKLISTYNNGNIFGVSLAIMAPLYLSFERRPALRLATYAALFLTLSRTAWIAAVLILFMRTLSKGARPITLLYILVLILVVGYAIFGLLAFLGKDVSFVLDSNLGGRAQQLDVLTDVRVVPEGQTSAIPEIAYLGVLRYFGIPGLLMFAAHLLMPVAILRAEGVRILSASRASACLQGLVIYAILAGADAAYSFIPVMMIFWMVAGWGLWYAHRPTQPMSGR